MDSFVRLEGRAVPLDRANVDTDAIIPKQFLTSIKRTGFGKNLFDEWRYMDRGEPDQDCSARPRNPSFVLNQPTWAGATILLAKDNFGCGSSREHAVWALMEYGFKAVIAPSFGDIFYHNSLKSGLLAIRLQPAEVDSLFDAVIARPDTPFHIDLEAQTVALAQLPATYRFEVDAFRKSCLLNGLDDIALTLSKAERVRAFEQQHWAAHPWLTAGN
jgi:3-isopropylmalate/(R)-2-methylmalate dehydratase small subunit